MKPLTPPRSVSVRVPDERLDAQKALIDCSRCGHPASWHRLDDSKNLDPTDPATPFRCIGYDCMATGPWRGDCTCPDYVDTRA